MAVVLTLSDAPQHLLLAFSQLRQLTPGGWTPYTFGCHLCEFSCKRAVEPDRVVRDLLKDLEYFSLCLLMLADVGKVNRQPACKRISADLVRRADEAMYEAKARGSDVRLRAL